MDESIKTCLQCKSTETPQWRTGPGGPKTLCNACGVRWGRQLAAAGKKPVKATHKKKAAAASGHGLKRKASEIPSSHHNTYHDTSALQSDEFEDEDASLCLPEESGGGSEFDCLAALNLMAMTTQAQLQPQPQPQPHDQPRASNASSSLSIVPDDLLSSLLPNLSSQDVVSLKNHCEAYDAACAEAEAAEAAIRAVEQVLDQRREVARVKAEAARFASETLFHAARKLTSLASLVSEPPLHHHASPRKCHLPKRSPF